LIQRFGCTLNLNMHFHMLFLDGVCTSMPCGKMGATEVGEAMLVYIKTGGFRETPVVDRFWAYSLPAHNALQ
jgi:hypothetical protein